MAGAAQANPGATERLLDVAGNGSLAELVAEAAKVRAGAQDLEQRRRVHQRRPQPAVLGR